VKSLSARAWIAFVLVVTPTACGGSDSHDAGLFAYDSAAPLAIQIESSWTNGDVRATDLTYVSPKGGRVPALLVAPRAKSRLPGLIVQHGLPGTLMGVLGVAEEFARLGAVVVAIDAPWARRGAADITLTAQDRVDQIQLIVDLRRAVDLLARRDDVDPERIGYLGISYGAMMSGLLAGVEDRIHAFVLSGGGGLVTLFTHSDHADPREATWPPEQRKRWFEAMRPIEPARWIGRARAPILFQSGRFDHDILPSNAKTLQRAARGPKKIVRYASGHALPYRAGCDAARWFGKYLAIAAERHPACE
jgi:uncharacterized protein